MERVFPEPVLSADDLCDMRDNSDTYELDLDD